MGQGLLYRGKKVIVPQHPSPIVVSLNKTLGDASGNTLITIQVNNSSGCISGTVCGVALSSFTIVDSTHVSGITGPMTASPTLGDVTVFNGYGTGTLSGVFEAFWPSNIPHCNYWQRADKGYNAGAQTWTDQISGKVFGTTVGYGVGPSTFPTQTTGANGKTALLLGAPGWIGNATPFGSSYIHEFFVSQNPTSSTAACPRDFGDNNGTTTSGNDPFFTLGSGTIYDPQNTDTRNAMACSGTILASPFVYEVLNDLAHSNQQIYVNKSNVLNDPTPGFNYATTGTPTYGRSRNGVSAACLFQEHIYLSQPAITNERNRIYAYLDDRYALTL